MKKTICIGLSTIMLLGLTGCGSTSGSGALWAVILAVLGLLILAAAGLRTYNFIQYRKRLLRRKNARRKIPTRPDDLTLILYVAAAVLLVAALVVLLLGRGGGDSAEDTAQSTTTEPTDPPVLFVPEKTAGSDPANWGVTWEVFNAGTLTSGYTREKTISFAEPGDYFLLPGVGTFRGNNYRDSATYGTATVTEQTLSTVWTTETSTLSGTEGRSWSGSGWTGQPLIVQWDDATKRIMNLYPEKQEKEGLVEVIYATLDGHIYFLDLDDGSYTRDPIEIGMAMKGAGSLDPRGFPLMYVGAGDGNGEGQKPKMFVISLIDGSILFSYGDNDPLSIRMDNEVWCAYDSAPLLDAETDTLIWPGENGMLYTFRLNTVYDRTAGTISVTPDAPVQIRYSTARSSEEDYWLGFEASASIIDRYLYISENGGMFYCMDLDTMELVWAQDTADDSNSSPVVQRIAEDEAYIYTAPSLHWTQDENAQGTISIYKLDALTGQIVWQVPYDNVHTVPSLSGGVQSTPLLGKAGSTIDGLILYSIARIPTADSGILVALDTETGEQVWRLDMEYYTWSSPVAFYEADGTAYVAVCDSAGYVMLIDGATGQVLSTTSVGSLVEASPAVYEDMLVVGTKGKLICGVQIQ